MIKIRELISKEKLQYEVYIGLSVGAIGLTGLLYFSNKFLFQRFIGGINPIMASFFIILLGFILISFLLSKNWFNIFKKENLKGLFRRSGLAALFAFITIFIEIKIYVFPADINILFPESLLYYPAIAFFAEILFHVLPLTILAITLTSIFKNRNYKKIIWICIIVTALLEPTYQTMPMDPLNQYTLGPAAIIWLNLFLFNLAQLIIFKRFDFVQMYSFRLVYYLIWHIGWGYLRLRLIF